MPKRSRSWAWPLATVLLAGLSAPVAARAEDGLVLYGAGSLREAMTEIGESFGRRNGVTVRTEFGASGRMRERIEAGEPVDLFTSADIGHARKLVADGRASVMAMFAQNTLCLLAPSRLGPVPSGSIVETLLRPDLKLGVSPARIDPLGDYTVELFRLLDGMRPGSLASLNQRSVTLDNPPGAPPPANGDYVLDALQAKRADLAIVYCSGRARYARLAPDAVMVTLPDDLQVGPQYGLALLKNARPAAALLALAILSPEGQAMLAKHGFKPVGSPATR